MRKKNGRESRWCPSCRGEGVCGRPCLPRGVKRCVRSSRRTRLSFSRLVCCDGCLSLDDALDGPRQGIVRAAAAASQQWGPVYEGRGGVLVRGAAGGNPISSSQALCLGGDEENGNQLVLMLCFVAAHWRACCTLLSCTYTLRVQYMSVAAGCRGQLQPGACSLPFHGAGGGWGSLQQALRSLLRMAREGC